MTNTQAQEGFDQMSGTKIEKLIWIASDVEKGDIVDIIQEVNDEGDINEFFGDVPSDYFKDGCDSDACIEMIFDYKKFGFIVEAYMPICSEFSFDENGEVRSWGHGGCSNIYYFYAETIEDLYSKIELKAEEHFNKCIQDFKDKNN